MSQEQALFNQLDGWMSKMIEMQQKKVLRIARELNPRLTSEDILNPQDRPELMRDHDYNFEDGTLSGLISAQIALRAEYNRWREQHETGK
jgi:hypothetical protein